MAPFHMALGISSLPGSPCPHGVRRKRDSSRSRRRGGRRKYSPPPRSMASVSTASRSISLAPARSRLRRRPACRRSAPRSTRTAAPPEASSPRERPASARPNRRSPIPRARARGTPGPEPVHPDRRTPEAPSSRTASTVSARAAIRWIEFGCSNRMGVPSAGTRAQRTIVLIDHTGIAVAPVVQRMLGSLNNSRTSAPRSFIERWSRPSCSAFSASSHRRTIGCARAHA
jgi:hypothetical protein